MAAEAEKGEIPSNHNDEAPLPINLGCIEDIIDLVVIAPQDQALVPEASTPEITMSVEEKSDQVVTSVPVGPESSKLAEPPIEASPGTATIPNGSEAKDVTDFAKEDSKPRPAEPEPIDSVQSSETATLPPVAAAELTKESNDAAEQSFDTSAHPVDDTVKEPVEKPEAEASNQPSETHASDEVNGLSEKPTGELVTAPAAPAAVVTNGDTRLDLGVKDAADQTTTRDTEIKKTTAGKGKRNADDAFGINGEQDRKKRKIDTTQNTTANDTVPAKKAGRPKKDRKILTPIGRTARKTRSQGPVEV
ncbi:hypothetical protein QBC44DRAFT_324033 [Cladorrhinum sp. PSN332]|nr:hypothetical protein QBC44DRAFT_324033 [Cladorrhinum sp. PSN332]